MKPQSKKAHKSLKFEDTDNKCICFNLRKAARVITQIYDEAFRPTGFRSTQMPLLVATAALGPVTVNRLAEAVVMDRTTLTRNLKPLEKQGLLRVKTVELNSLRRSVLAPGTMIRWENPGCSARNRAFSSRYVLTPPSPPSI